MKLFYNLANLKLNFICSWFYNFSFYYSSKLNFTTNLLLCRSIFGADNVTDGTHLTYWIMWFSFFYKYLSRLTHIGLYKAPPT